MMNTDHLCMSCMREIGDENQCPYCGFHADSPQLAPYLPLRTVVAERYLAGKLLDDNGDGATYMGWDLEMNAPVTIREFLPDSIAERREDLSLAPMAGCEITYRDCYQSFLELWRKQIQNGIESIMERPLIMTSSQLLLGNSQLYLAIHVCSDGIFCPL